MILEQQALFVSRNLLVVSIVIQTIELLAINKNIKTNKIWLWCHLKNDWNFAGVQKLLSFFLDNKQFSYLLYLRLVVVLSLLVLPLAIMPVILLLLSYLVALRFRGPFNGGSDYMTMQLLLTLSIYNYIENPHWRAVALWYLSVQVVLSYFIAGWVKLKRPEWRSGLALSRFVLNSNYRVPEVIKKPFVNPIFCFFVSWSILLFECFFPLVLAWPQVASYFVLSALFFHLSVFYIFGLNRFVWAWTATYPILLYCSYNSMLRFNFF